VLLPGEQLLQLADLQPDRYFLFLGSVCSMKPVLWQSCGVHDYSYKHSSCQRSLCQTHILHMAQV
jgi:hypothetical protein